MRSFLRLVILSYLALIFFSYKAQGVDFNFSCNSDVQLGKVNICSMSLVLAPNETPTAIEVTITLPPGVTTTGIVLSSQAIAAGKTVQCSPSICIVYGNTQIGGSASLGSGVIGQLPLLFTSVVKGNTTPTCQNCVNVGIASIIVVDPTASVIASTINPPLSISIKPSACDIDGDGLFTSTDVTSLAREVVKLTPAIHDLNADGNVDIRDLQLMINAVNSGVCPI